MVLVDDRVISTKLAFRAIHLVTDEFQGFVICLYKESSYESFLLPLIHLCISVQLTSMLCNNKNFGSDLILQVYPCQLTKVEGKLQFTC